MKVSFNTLIVDRTSSKYSANEVEKCYGFIYDVKYILQKSVDEILLLGYGLD